ncbi:hypothetical protein [Acinetobacter baumannii]|uniref:hypothetical protein n=1 Tax=Acinetobacter baumannii TaxID=470 RepID=UPI00189BCAAF|nr:hypothetical protein [Acinetobacter baumannii]MBF6689273.1 hypothetical protein [Acinetobacter baumannii]MBF6971096.1 hypothetical protein [Acinetobacter baumannii]
MSNNTVNNNDDLKEETLIELIHLKNCLGLFSKTSIKTGEQINPEEINSLFTTMHDQVNKIIQKFESTL